MADFVVLIVRGSIWIALAAFAAAHVGFRRTGRDPLQVPLTLYWMGAAFLLVHIVAVFHWHHDWSHARAVAATAEETARVFGLDWGGGVWVNYAFLAGWVTDAWRRTHARTQSPRVTAVGWTARAGALVVIFNGAIVFVPWPRSLAGMAIVAVLAWAWRGGVTRRRAG
ncbi:MAG TPA: hypothetical protein VMM93_03950 [Vicinamibacterales bacterium]|nr:hypothetical protein [Vicinamibacterales bacterium]